MNTGGAHVINDTDQVAWNAANAAIYAITRPPGECPWCFAERGETHLFPYHATTRLCERHRCTLEDQREAIKRRRCNERAEEQIRIMGDDASKSGESTQLMLPPSLRLQAMQRYDEAQFQGIEVYRQPGWVRIEAQILSRFLPPFDGLEQWDFTHLTSQVGVLGILVNGGRARFVRTTVDFAGGCYSTYLKDPTGQLERIAARIVQAVEGDIGGKEDVYGDLYDIPNWLQADLIIWPSPDDDTEKHRGGEHHQHL
jgi:hypothetical protein